MFANFEEFDVKSGIFFDIIEQEHVVKEIFFAGTIN